MESGNILPFYSINLTFNYEFYYTFYLYNFSMPCSLIYLLIFAHAFLPLPSIKWTSVSSSLNSYILISSNIDTSCVIFPYLYKCTNNKTCYKFILE